MGIPEWMTIDLSSPLDMGALIVLIYVLWKTVVSKYVFPPAPPTPPEPQLPLMKEQDLTLEQLKKYDGSTEDGRLLMAVDGKIFDVTKNKAMYGKDGPYGLFPGHDASRGLATFVANASCLREFYDDLADLSPEEISEMKEWAIQFSERYPIVGRLLKPGQQPDIYDVTDEEDNTEDKKVQ